jgi:hypothetical protein
MTDLDLAAIMTAHEGHRTDKFGVCRDKFWSRDLPCEPYRLAAAALAEANAMSDQRGLDWPHPRAGRARRGGAVEAERP